MPEARIGRLLGACLQQAISERLPQRLDFYEHWLGYEELRNGRIGLARMTAVIGFLRTEGAAYDHVMSRAGQLAAEWTIASLTPVRRRTISWLPRSLRTRAALSVAAGIARAVSSATRTSTRVSRTSACVEVRASLFCTVRETRPEPLCAFYLEATLEALRSFEIIGVGHIERCCAVRGASCLVAIELAGTVVVTDPAMAA